jgi:recombination protein RecR
LPISDCQLSIFVFGFWFEFEVASQNKDRNRKSEMLEYAEPVTKLIDELKRLPSIGQKSAQRLAFHLMRAPDADLERLIAALREVKQRIILCSVCNNLTEVDPCRFCSSPTRDHSVICVVEEPHSLVAVEKTRSFKGVYHVLHGSLSPIRHIGPSELHLANLLPRLKPENNDGVVVNEVILATNPTTEGKDHFHFSVVN